jgi:hypothetical protein
VQARTKAFHEAKQQLADEAKSLLELEISAKARATADAEKLEHAELARRFEAAKEELQTKHQLDASHEAAVQLKREVALSEEVACLALEDSDVSLDSTQAESSIDAASDDVQDDVEYHDGATIPEHEMDPAFEPASEVVLVKDCVGDPLAPEDQLKMSELDVGVARVAQVGAGFVRVAVFASCAVAVIAMAVHATFELQ